MRVLAVLAAALLLPTATLAQAPAPAAKPATPKPPIAAASHTTPAPKPPTQAPKPPAAARAVSAHPAPQKGRPKPPPPRRAPPPAPAAPPPPAAETKPAEPQKGTNTSLPLPRFAALRSDDVNFRSGPGARYPIEWVYKRRDLPVEIEREFDIWRLVEDSEGFKGWVHQATLAPRRTAVVIGAERTLRATADDKGAVVARLKPGVILRLRSCAAGSDWCEAQAGDYRGWVKRNEIWGLLPGEAVQ